ncbi:MAG: hypothetical protein HFACDABA_01040 [Anaerolineales bacterium]|nr:hypothetical protein [Anaerolineales bacterium]
MKNLPPILRALLLVDIGTTAILIVVTALGWLVGWRTSTQFSNGFFILGAALAVFGAYSALSASKTRGKSGMSDAQSDNNASADGRNKRILADLAQGINTAYITTGIGLMLIVASILIPILFG